MKIIDFHTHFFPNRLFEALWRWFEAHAWPIQYKHYADDLIAILKKEGVTQAVSLHYPHQAAMAESLNEWAYRLGGNYPDFIIPFGSVHPDDTDKEGILKRCFEDFGFKGIKLHCHVQKFEPTDSRMEAAYEVCNAYGRIVLIHCGTGPHFKDRPTNGYGYDVESVSGVKRFEPLLKKYPHITFVVPHLGYEEIDGFIGLLKDHPNLHLDTAMALADYFPVQVRKEWLEENSDRILFGSDFPNIPYEWSREKKKLLEMGLQNVSRIFYDNAAALLKL